jgi:trk system potassium uptake protein TrkA
MYMIIVGAGSIGTSLIDIAVKEKNNVVVIEANPDRAKEVSSKYDITVLNSNATSAETLREAGSERADALIATTSDDAVNLMVVSIAEELEIPSVVSVVNDKEHADFFRKLGANVLQNPEEVVANHLYNAAKRPKFEDFAILSSGAQIFRLTIGKGSPLAGKKLSTSTKRDLLPSALSVVVIERGEEHEIPTGDTMIKMGDVLTFFSANRVSDELIDKLVG